MGYQEKVVKYKYNGQSVRSYCIENNLSYSSVFAKIRKGISIEKAIELTHLKYIKYDETKDLSYIAEQYRVKYKKYDLANKRILKRMFFQIDASERILVKYWEHITQNIPVADVKEEEIWKTTKENLQYQVSNFSRFRRVNKTATAKYSPIKPFIHTKSRRLNGPTKKVLFVKLGSKEYLAKKVIANAFLDNPYKYTCVMQKDGKLDNIKLDNLKWVSASYFGKTTGHLSKSKPVEVIIDNKIKKYRSVRNCAKNMGVSYQTVLNYLNLNKKVKNPKFKVRYTKGD